MAAQDVVRWQMDLPQSRAQELDEFSGKYGFATRKDLMNTALSLLQWAIKEVRGGRIIASLDEDNMRYKQLEIPAFKIAASESAVPPVVKPAEVARASELLAEVDRMFEHNEDPKAIKAQVKAAAAALEVSTSV